MDNEIENIIKIWRNFCQKQTKFKLSPDLEKVKRLARGVFENEKSYGFKFCPCRMTLGDRQKDAKLICPCNFFIQKTWRKNGECWCGLFVKK